MLEAPRISLAFQPLDHVIDGGIAERARIGVIILASDHTVEYEFRTLLDLPGVGFYGARISNSPIITPDSLRAMKDGLAQQASVILPGVELDVVAYGCTSASMVIGEEAVFECLRNGRPEAKPTTPITAAFAAFNAFNAKRIAVITPYTSDVNSVVHRYITDNGFDVPVFGSFNEKDDNIASCISPDSMRQACIDLGRRDDVDMVFVSCTSLRLAEVIADIETVIDKPVTSSNHAMAWHCLRLAGIEDQLPGFGRLFAV